jgi:hypothetical protein
MWSSPRLALCALAALALPAMACEIQPPAEDASSYEGVQTEVTPGVARAQRTTLDAGGGRTRSSRVPSTLGSEPSPSPRTTMPSLDETPDPYAGGSDGDSSRSALRAFVAGGEARFLCPTGYRATAADGSCACLAAVDGVTRYPFGDAPCGDGTPRAEGNECIFTCPAE